jgi:3-deoxy-D-manno-octulosonic-acid transferase
LLLDAGYIVLAVPAVLLSLLRGKRATLMDHLARRVLTAVPEREERGPCLWLHGVSVGEVLAARSVAGAAARECPDWTVVVSSSTRAGVEAAQIHFRDYLVFSCPLDLSWLVRRSFRRLRPDAVVIVEHDLWPNWLRQARARGVPVAMVNARLSRRSLKWYERLTRLSPWIERHLALVCVQDEGSAEGFRRLGFGADKLKVTGNLKFDSPTPPVSGVREALGFSAGDWVLVAASTHAGEEEALLDVFTRVRERDPHSYLLLVPRRPERTEEVAALIRARGLGFALRSQGQRSGDEVLLVDTVGELARLSAAADLVFVGGSLVPVGGHNVVEPASLGKPVLLGPHFHNQKSVVASFLEREALVVVRDGNELVERVLELKGDPSRAAELGERARQTVLENVGAGERTFEALRDVVLARCRTGPGL